MNVVLASLAGDIIVWVVWIVAAIALLASGTAVVLFRNPFYSALALIGNLASLAVLYLLLSSEFVAAAQVLVYAGAIVVMFLFVIAYVGGTTPWPGRATVGTLAAVLACAAIAVEIVVAIGLEASDQLSDSPEIASAFGSPAEIGRQFLSNHLLAFEAISIVLLVAAVGGVILGTELAKERDQEQEQVES